MSATQYCSDMPCEFPGTAEADRYLGRLFRRFSRMTDMLEDAVSYPCRYGSAAVDSWMKGPSGKGLTDIQEELSKPALIDKEHCESLDELRDLMNRLYGGYSGTVFDYMRIMDAAVRVEDAIVYLDHVLCGEGPGTVRDTAEDIRRRMDISDAMRACDHDRKGWCKLSDVGAVLHSRGR